MSVFFHLCDNVAVLTMDEGENRTNLDFIGKFNAVLDEIETKTEANALIITSAHEKVFSNGLDLEWLFTIAKQGKKVVNEFFKVCGEFDKRLLTYPMPLIAAINGHAFAGGAILACLCDYRFMRADRGFFCMPEVDLGLEISPGMMAVMRKCVPSGAFLEVVLEGKRLTAGDCKARGIINRACPVETLLDEAIEFAKPLNKKRDIVAALKREMNRDVLHALDVLDPPFLEALQFFVSQ